MSKTALTRIFSVLVLIALCPGLLASAVAAEQVPPDGTPVPVGSARVDITPDYPIRLSGYAGRLQESDGIEQRIWAKAIAIGSDADGPVLLMNLETCVIPTSLTRELAGRLERKAKVSRERLALCATHTHSAPYLTGALPTMFGQPLPDEQQARIDEYTSWLIDQLEKVALEALANRREGRLSWAQGEVGFAMNRRLPVQSNAIHLRPHPAGPVDHAMPVLKATDKDGKVVALVVNYACHCTTLGGDFMKICGDWAGYAQDYLEAEHAGATCLVIIGCGADANPEPRLKLEHAQQHGRAIAREVGRLMRGEFKPLPGRPTCRYETIKLLFEKVPTRAEWEELLEKGGPQGYQAKLNLERLDRGEPPQVDLTYPVQTWTFGSDLAMVFLAGEVVVDYSLRLKREFDSQRLWVTAYANEVPCYIPSARVLSEGGYEATTSMIYYDRPGPLSSSTEELIVSKVRELMPEEFRETQPAN